MPTTHEHIAKAQAFERVLTVFDDQNPDHWDWIVTVAFYAALHWVDSYLASHGHHPQNHRVRNHLIAMLPIRGDYSELYVLSRQARYGAGHLERDEALRARDHLLPQIRQWIHGQIGWTP